MDAAIHQSLHPDFETYLPNTQYFFLGNGKIQTAVQWSEDPGCTPLGLLISDPAHFSRKWSSYLFHPEYGLERTQLTLIIDGQRKKPVANSLHVQWDNDAVEPAVVAQWKVDELTIRETFRCPAGESMLVRDVEIVGLDREVEIEIALYASNALFSWFKVSEHYLEAGGFASIKLWSSQEAQQNERFLTVKLQPVKGTAATSFYYELEPEIMHPEQRREDALVREQHYWLMASSLED
ncbi:MAG TPA: hypothetical protein VEF04_22700, partial [Blastocatellia bacterium]|nr:hypothetical protein [Blastocatellia bacterium]